MLLWITHSHEGSGLDFVLAPGVVVERKLLEKCTVEARSRFQGCNFALHVYLHQEACRLNVKRVCTYKTAHRRYK